MRIHLLTLALLLVLFSACKKDNDSEPDTTIVDGGSTTGGGTETNNNGTTTSDLEVPDGFNFVMSKLVTFDLTSLNSEGDKMPGTLIKVYGIQEDEEPEELYSGAANDQGKLNTKIEIPNHFVSLVVETKSDGIIKQFGYSLSEVIQAILKVDNLIGDGGAETRSNNCYPSTSATYEIEKVTVVADQEIGSVTFQYANGTSKVFTNITGASYFYGNPEICGDGIDNDGNGLTDCADPKCAGDDDACLGTLPCIEGFFQLTSGILKQLDPVTGQYVTLGTLDNGYSSYNGSGYNSKDGFIYCIAKSSADNKLDFIRIHNDATYSKVADLDNYQGASFTGDFDEHGVWRNIFYLNGNWHMASIDPAASPVVFTTQQINGNGLGSENFHDIIYNAVCGKFYILTQSGTKLLAIDHNAPTPSIEVVGTFTDFLSGSYGAGWSAQDGNLYVSHNSTGNIYKILMDENCLPVSQSFVFTGTATNQNDGMSCPFSTAPIFSGLDSDHDGISDQAEIAASTNPFDPCHPYITNPNCVEQLYGLIVTGSDAYNVSYIKVEYVCDAPLPYTISYNNSLNNDLDGDGVTNDEDPDPLDPDKAFVQYKPSQNSYGTLAFEDLWPAKGDYDFNDFVIQIKENIVTNRQNNVYEIKLECRIMAMGGIYNNDFGIAIPDPNGVAEVEVFAPLGVEFTERDDPGTKVITINRPKYLLGYDGVINVLPAATYHEPIEFQVVIQLDGSFKFPAGYHPKFFLEGNGVDGHEIHLPGVAPTANMLPGLLGSVNDDSNGNSGKYFQSSTNLPWALYIPKAWDHPLEGVDLLSAYTQFSNFVQSNSAIPWYLEGAQYRNNEKIFKR